MAAETKSDSSDVSSEESDGDESLGLEGVLERNPDASSSSSSDESEDEEDEEEEEKGGQKNKRKLPANEKKSKKKREMTIQVDFTFCDMKEMYFHGLKSLLNNSSTVYQLHSSEFCDKMIESVAVGTLISTADDGQEGNVFGFASFLNMAEEYPAMEYLKEICLKDCPQDHKKQLQKVLTGPTTGLFLHGRMINLPLEITLVLHEQLVKDMDWAIKNAEGGEEERNSLNFTHFVRLAPCQQDQGVVYRYFDDEIFAGQAEYVFTVDAPKSYSKEEKQLLNIMVLTRAGHRQAMKDLKQMIG
jgi:hypothetical protein